MNQALSKGSFATIDLLPSQLLRLTVVQGHVWITMEGDATDYVAARGEKISFDHPGRVVVEALEECAFAFSLTEVNGPQFDSPKMAA